VAIELRLSSGTSAVRGAPARKRHARPTIISDQEPGIAGRFSQGIN